MPSVVTIGDVREVLGDHVRVARAAGALASEIGDVYGVDVQGTVGNVVRNYWPWILGGVGIVGAMYFMRRRGRR